MSFDVQVTIDLTKPIGKQGFGVPLILVENASKAVAFTEVSSLSEVVVAGFADTTKAHKAAKLLFAQANAPRQIAVCAVTGTAVDALADGVFVGKGWRQLIVVNEGESASTVTDIATAVEALDGKMYFAGLEVDDATAIEVTGLRRTVLFYCDATEAVPVPVAALVGESAGRKAGTFTYKNLVLSGVAAQDLTVTEIDAIHAKGGMTFVTKAGDNVTSDGKVAGGEYIDSVDNEDYIIQQLAYKTQKVLNTSAKVPYDNNGIAMLENVAADVLKSAYNDGMIATKADGSPDYSVSYALREDVAESDRTARKYLGGNFTFTLASAVHFVRIAGSITA